MKVIYTYRLSEIASLVTGSTPLTNNYFFWGGDIPFYSPADFDGRVFCESTEKRVTELGAKTGRLIPSGAIMVTCIGSIGKMAICGSSGITNQQINALILKPNFDVRYVYYVLLNGLSKLIRFAPQTTIPIINKTDFGKLEFGFHNYLFQRKISRILKSIDTAIEKTEALIEKYQQIKSGLMHDLFTRGVLPNGQLRPTREQAPELYQETKIGWIPKEWGINSFGEKIEVIDPNPSHRYPPEIDEGYPLCSTENFYGEDDFNLKKSKFVPVAIYSSQNNRCKFKETDVIFARKGQIGLARRYGATKKVFSHTVVILKPLDDLVNEEWLLWLSRSNWLLKAIEVTMNTNSGVPTLGVAFVKNISVPFPTIEEQKNTSKLLDSISRKIQVEQMAREKLRLQKLGLMQDLLTGKVPVTVSENADQEEAHA